MATVMVELRVELPDDITFTEKELREWVQWQFHCIAECRCDNPIEEAVGEPDGMMVDLVGLRQY